MLLGLVALVSSNAFAVDQNILANVKVTGTTGVIYAPVVEGKAPLKYTIITAIDNNGDGKFKSGTVKVEENGVEMKTLTSITIPAEVVIPVTVSGSEETHTFQVTTIADNGFTATNSNALATVILGSNVTTIGTSAFQNVATLKNLTFGGNETTIGNSAFQGTALTGVENTLTLPSKLVTIGQDAFSAGTSKYPTFSAVSIPATVQTIGVAAFEGCENLSTVTLAADSWLRTIGISAFAYTSLTELDLSNATKWKTGTTVKGMEEFGTEDASYGPFTSATHAKTSLITKVTLPNTCVTIHKSAFKDVQYLNDLGTIGLTKVKIINANAFEGCAALTSVQIGTAAGANDVTVGANAFSGCVKLATVELGQIGAATIDAAAFDGYDSNDDDDFEDDGEYAASGIKTLKFNTISAEQTTKPFAKILTIEAVHFQTYIAGNSFIPAAYFDVNAAGAKLTKIYYNAVTVPAAASIKQPFAVNAFGTSNDDADRVATLYTKLAQYTNANGFSTNAKLLNGIIIEAGYSANFVIGNTSEKLLKDKNSNNYYYYFNNDSGDVVSVDKKNGENKADVAVYQVYTDATDALNIYFMPLAVVGGKYGIANGEIVIIKSNMENGVVATPGGNSTMMEIGGNVLNELMITDAAYSKLGVMSNANLLANGTKEVHFFNNPATSGFGFTPYDSSKQNGLAENCVYLQTDPIASGRVNMIWLDENGSTTAIETIETKAETVNNAAIYNVAGQKVSADYKGLVIKNGRKFIQK